MDLLEQKKARLAALMAEIAEMTDTPVYQYFYIIQRRVKLLSDIVHRGQVDKAGKPYSQHAKRLACKGNHLVLWCALLLHDVVEDGGDLGITIQFLRDELKIPAVIVDIVECLSRAELETYPEYVKRIMQNYQAQKGKIIDNIDNADVSRFDNPTRQDVLRCTRYLEKAQYIKSNLEFQQKQKLDYVHDILAMHKLKPMVQDYTDRVRTDELIEQFFYFGYEGQPDRSYVLHLRGAIDPETDKTTMVVRTYPSCQSLADWHVWVPRQQMLEFKTNFDAMQYMSDCSALLQSGGLGFNAESSKAFGEPTAVAQREEVLFVRALTEFYA